MPRCATNYHKWNITKWRKVKSQVRGRRVIVDGIPLDATCLEPECPATIRSGVYFAEPEGVVTEAPTEPSEEDTDSEED